MLPISLYGHYGFYVLRETLGAGRRGRVGQVVLEARRNLSRAGKPGCIQNWLIYDFSQQDSGGRGKGIEIQRLSVVTECRAALPGNSLGSQDCLFHLPVNAQMIKNRSRGVSFICQTWPGIIRPFACQCLQAFLPSSSTLACQLALSTWTDYTSSPARWVGI